MEPDDDAYSRQIHDYNPGYLGEWPSGIFWTIPIDSEAFTIDPDTGEALYSVHDLDIPDYGNIANAFANGPTLPGKVSFDCRFFPTEDSQSYTYDSCSDPTEQDDFVVDYRDVGCTLEWTGETEGGFSFESYAVGDYPEGRVPGRFFAVAGREWNGAFADEGRP